MARSEQVQADFDKVKSLMQTKGMKASEACVEVGRKPDWYYSQTYADKVRAKKKSAAKKENKPPVIIRRKRAANSNMPEVINLEVVPVKKTLTGYFMLAVGDEKQVLEFARGLQQ